MSLLCFSKEVKRWPRQQSQCASNDDEAKTPTLSTAEKVDHVKGVLRNVPTRTLRRALWSTREGTSAGWQAWSSGDSF